MIQFLGIDQIIFQFFLLIKCHCRYQSSTIFNQDSQVIENSNDFLIFQDNFLFQGNVYVIVDESN